MKRLINRYGRALYHYWIMYLLSGTYYFYMSLWIILYWTQSAFLLVPQLSLPFPPSLTTPLHSWSLQEVQGPKAGVTTVILKLEGTILSGAMLQIIVALLPLVGFSYVVWLTLSLMPPIFNINCYVGTSELQGLSPFSRTQMAEKNSKGVPSTHLFHHLCTTVFPREMFFPWAKEILSSL